jgi:hypothetical protein
MAEQVKSQYEKENNQANAGTGSELTNYITRLFEAFATSRQPWEEIWEECWYNFLGQYQSDLSWRSKTEGTGGRSRIFIKLTTLKCNTAHSKICDVLFGGRNTVPFDCIPYDYEALGIPPDAAKDMADLSKKRLTEYFRKIDLEEVMGIGILELCILGYGILKGPNVIMRKTPSVRQRRIGNMPVSQIDQEVSPYEITMEKELIAVVDHVPLWEYYTDFNARNPKDSIGEIHFKRLLPDHFLQYAGTDGYIRENVLEAARRATNNDPNDKRYIQLGERYAGVQGEKDKRVSVVEYWGLVPVSALKAHKAQLPDDVGDDESIEALVVLAADGIVCKATVNPLGFRPFFGCPCKERPGVLAGMGFAEAMRDSQKMVNSAARMYIDNKAISGNQMIGVNIDRINTKKTKNLDIYPGKTWWVKGNFAPRDAIEAVNIPDNTAGQREMIEMFERFSDEETGLPKYTSGQQDSFLNKTASGMSMLMSQANIGLKSVMKNIDNYWIEPLVEAYHSFLNEMEGRAPIPIRVKACGSDALIAKELKMENIMRAFQVTAQPQDAIFMDRPKAMKEIFRILETDDLMRSDEEVKALIEQMAKQAGAPKDLREMVDIDRLYPFLYGSERVQILEQLGVAADQAHTMDPAPMQMSQQANKAPKKEEKVTDVLKGLQ